MNEVYLTERVVRVILSCTNPWQIPAAMRYWELARKKTRGKDGIPYGDMLSVPQLAVFEKCAELEGGDFTYLALKWHGKGLYP